MTDSFGRGRSPRWPWPQGTRVAAVMAAMAGIVLLAAACGGNSPSSTATGGSTAGESTYYQKALAYAQCMRSHGVPSYPGPDSQGQLPPLQIGRNGVTQQAVQSAQSACRNLQPGGGQGGTQQQPGRVSQALNFSKCMRAHGVLNFPDPTVGNSGVSYNMTGVNTSSPQFQSAQRACQSPR